MKIDDPGMQRSIFKVKHVGSIDFSINQKTTVQEPSKVSVFSRQEKTDIPDWELNPDLQITSLAC